MAVPSKATMDALGQCGPLIKYAAETINDKDKQDRFATIVSDIEDSLAAMAPETWTPQIATKFWIAYSNLCSIVSPASADTLTTSNALSPGSKLTQPQRIVRNYICVFIVLLLLSVLISFYTSTITTVNNEANNLIKNTNTLATEIQGTLAALQIRGADTGQDFTLLTSSAAPADVSKLMAALPTMYANADNLYAKSATLSTMISSSYPVCADDQDPNRAYCYRVGNGGLARNIVDAQSNVDDYRLLSRRAADRIEKSQTNINLIKSTILPILLGMTGACAYVIRTISEQIRASSFSSTSAIRHFVRITLGALAGVAIGFGGLFTDSTVSASALSFLAGYSIEPVFSTFDRIAANFK